MSEASMETQPSLEQLQEAVGDPRWDFRTLEGIADDLALPPEDVAEMLSQHPEIIRKSVLTDHEGNELYAPRDRPPTAREWLERVRWILAH